MKLHFSSVDVEIDSGTDGSLTCNGAAIWDSSDANCPELYAHFYTLFRP